MTKQGLKKFRYVILAEDLALEGFVPTWTGVKMGVRYTITIDKDIRCESDRGVEIFKFEDKENLFSYMKTPASSVAE